MNISDLSSIINAKNNNINLNKKIKNFSIDTRNMKKDDIFIALKGNGDGHDYLNMIKKATGVIVNKDYVSEKMAVLKVDDTLKSLKKIATYQRNQ